MTTEFEEWQKKTAMTCNNRAWSLCEQSRTAGEDLEMLTTAHAAAYHWAQVGTELNHMRALALLAHVHAFLGHGALAFSMGTQMRDYFLARKETPDWELAFTHAIYAHCAHAAGKVELRDKSYQHAATALAAIADAEDREIFLKTFSQIPAP
jgi:hypothetical protein